MDQRKTATLRRSKGLYNQVEVAELVGVTWNQLRYMIEAGYAPAPKRIEKRRPLYTESDVATIRNMLEGVDTAVQG
jgi:DNA-binding transcriptional MerR regulator